MNMTIEGVEVTNNKEQSINTYNHVLARYAKEYNSADEYMKIILKLWLYTALTESGYVKEKSVITFEHFKDNLKLFDAVLMVKGSAIDVTDIGDGSKNYVISLIMANNEGLS